MATTAGRLGIVTYLGLVGFFATLLSALTGMVLVMIVTAPMSLISVLLFPLLMAPFGWALVYAAPVTLGVLPLAAALLRARPVTAQLVLPLVGAAAGGATMQIWATLDRWPGPGSDVLVMIGAIAGCVAGAIFGRATGEIRR
jgi:hypothetical protein